MLSTIFVLEAVATQRSRHQTRATVAFVGAVDVVAEMVKNIAVVALLAITCFLTGLAVLGALAVLGRFRGSGSD